MDGVTVDSTDINLAGRTAILDTGTTLMVIPPDDAAAVHAAIPGSATDGQGNFAVPCDTTSVVALGVGGTQFTINPKDVAFQPLSGAGTDGLCLSGISSGQIGGPNEWLVGDVFLKNVSDLPRKLTSRSACRCKRLTNSVAGLLRDGRFGRHGRPRQVAQLCPARRGRRGRGRGVGRKRGWYVVDFLLFLHSMLKLTSSLSCRPARPTQPPGPRPLLPPWPRPRPPPPSVRLSRASSASRARSGVDCALPLHAVLGCRFVRVGGGKKGGKAGGQGARNGKKRQAAGAGALSW